ncbi:MAG: EamA family transporter [Nocardioidaceae bacterium]
METIPLRDVLVTAAAPVAWGTTYVVTETMLPPDRPLLAAVLRALPAGLVLLAFKRRLPRGEWWWRSAVLGLCNIGLFFPLIFLAAYQLPSGLAATVQATSPLAVMTLAWPMLAERPESRRVLGAVVGLLGVGLLVMRASGEVTTVGLLAAFGSVLMSAIGFVLVKRWPAAPDESDLLTRVSWQLLWGALFLIPVAFLVEGPPPALTTENLVGYAWLTTAGTALAYFCWFRGLAVMPAGAVALVGLVNPVVGTLLGVIVLHEVFGLAQAVGMVLVLGGVVAGQSRRAPRESVLDNVPRASRMRSQAGARSRRAASNSMPGRCIQPRG